MEPLLLLIIPLFQVIIGVVVFLKNPKNTANWSFALIMISASGWAATSSNAEYVPLHLLTLDERLSFMFGALIGSAFLIFALSTLHLERFGAIYYLPLVPGIFFAILSLTPVVARTYTREDGVIHPTYGEGLPFYAGFFISFMILALSILVIKFHVSKGLEKRRIGYIVLGSIISAVVGTTTSLIWPWLTNQVNLDKIGATASIFFTLFTAYAILKYRFLDVRVIIRKSLVHTLLIAVFFGFVAFLVALLARSLEDSLNTGTFASAAIIAILLSASYIPFQKAIQHLVNPLFFQTPAAPASTLPEDAQELRDKAGEAIGKSLNTEKAEIVFLKEFPSREWKQSDIKALILHFATHKAALRFDQMSLTRDEGTLPPDLCDTLERLLLAHNLTVIIPMYDQEVQLMACMIVGTKSKGMYTEEEMNYVQAFAGAVALRLDQILSEDVLIGKKIRV